MKKVLLLLTISFSIFSMNLLDLRVPRSGFFVAREGLDPLELYHKDKRFFIFRNDKMTKVQKFYIDQLVTNITREQLDEFLKVGYLVVDRTNYGEFSITTKMY